MIPSQAAEPIALAIMIAIGALAAAIVLNILTRLRANANLLKACADIYDFLNEHARQNALLASRVTNLRREVESRWPKPGPIDWDQRMVEAYGADQRDRQREGIPSDLDSDTDELTAAVRVLKALKALRATRASDS